MRAHIIIRFICLVLFALVAWKQYEELSGHENGAKSLRKKLFGLTVGFIVLSVGSLVFLLNAFSEIMPLDHVVTIYTGGLVFVSVTWFYIYYSKS